MQCRQTRYDKRQNGFNICQGKIYVWTNCRLVFPVYGRYGCEAEVVITKTKVVWLTHCHSGSECGWCPLGRRAWRWDKSHSATSAWLAGCRRFRPHLCTWHGLDKFIIPSFHPHLHTLYKTLENEKAGITRNHKMRLPPPNTLDWSFEDMLVTVAYSLFFRIKEQVTNYKYKWNN